MEKLCIIIFLCFFQTLPILSARILKCLPSEETLKKLENQYEVKIADLNHSITFNYDDNISITNTTVDFTKIYLRKIEVNFTGYIVADKKNNGYVLANLSTRKNVIHRFRQQKFFSGKDKHYCKVINWDSSQLRLNLSKAALIMEDLTKLCVEDSICKHYDTIISDLFLLEEKQEPIVNSHTNNSSVLQFRNSKSTAIADSNKQSTIIVRNVISSEQPYNPQNTINAIFDFAVSAVITIFAGNEDGVMKLPYIDQNYKFAGATGEFEAINGTFIDLRALHRVKNIILTNVKDRFMIATSFTLDKAKLTFPEYRLRYGYIKINGHLDVDIEGITVSLKLAADYNASPCQVHLVDLTMDELGPMQVDFTGLGWPLNSAVRLAIRYVIEYKVFEIAKDIAAVKMKEINCEQFRPSLDMLNGTNKYDKVVFFKTLDILSITKFV